MDNTNPINKEQFKDIEKKNNKIDKYLNSLGEKEKIALTIAKEDLCSSFDIEKSIGFLEFCKNE
jgi:CRISPR/Cas system-associated protein Cas7 (RAMP superfamily)